MKLKDVVNVDSDKGLYWFQFRMRDFLTKNIYLLQRLYACMLVNAAFPLFENLCPLCTFLHSSFWKRAV